MSEVRRNRQVKKPLKLLSTDSDDGFMKKVHVKKNTLGVTSIQNIKKKIQLQSIENLNNTATVLSYGKFKESSIPRTTSTAIVPENEATQRCDMTAQTVVTTVVMHPGAQMNHPSKGYIPFYYILYNLFVI